MKKGDYKSFSRRIFGYFQTLVVFALSILLLVMVIYLSVRCDRTFTLPSGIRPLSPRANEMLSSVNEDVSCTAILPRSDPFYLPLHNLLLNMRDAMKPAKLDVRMLDPHMDLSASADAATQYSMSGWGVVFKNAAGRVEKVPYESLVERIEKDPDVSDHTQKDSFRFRGEEVCVTAINRLRRPTSPIIYVLTGHGERDFANYDKLTGYSDLAREINREGYVLRPLLLGESTMPDDCDLLIIPGPRYAPTASEAAAIESYLSSGGRLLMLIDRAATLPSGWEGVLDRMGLSTANLTAIDKRTLGGSTLLVDRFSAHPIAHDLEKSAVYFVSPQVFNLSSKASSSRGLFSMDVVAAAPAGAWGETNPEVYPRRYDAKIDVKGFLPIAVAVEVAGGRDIGLKPMRAFVIGDSNFGTNMLIAGGRTANRDMLLNAINWLTENQLASAPSLQVEGNALRLGITRTRQIRYWFYSVVCWPLASVVLGFFVSCLRRVTA